MYRSLQSNYFFSYVNYQAPIATKEKTPNNFSQNSVLPSYSPSLQVPLPYPEQQSEIENKLVSLTFTLQIPEVATVL